MSEERAPLPVELDNALRETIGRYYFGIDTFTKDPKLEVLNKYREAILAGKLDPRLCPPDAVKAFCEYSQHGEFWKSLEYVISVIITSPFWISAVGADVYNSCNPHKKIVLPLHVLDANTQLSPAEKDKQISLFLNKSIENCERRIGEMSSDKLEVEKELKSTPEEVVSLIEAGKQFLQYVGKDRYWLTTVAAFDFIAAVWGAMTEIAKGNLASSQHPTVG